MKKFLLPVLSIFVLAIGTASAQIIMRAVDSEGRVIKGEAFLRGYEDLIEVQSYSMGIAGCSNVSGTAGTSRAKCAATIGDLNWTTILDRSSTSFKKALLEGKALQSLDLTFIGGNQEVSRVYYRIRMEDVLITSFQESGSSADRPFTSVSASGSRIAWAYYYYDQQSGAKVEESKFGWDVARNRAWDYRFPASPQGQTY